MKEHATAKTKLEDALRADLDRATARAGNQVADAIRRLQLNQEHNQERMQVRGSHVCFLPLSRAICCSVDRRAVDFAADLSVKMGRFQARHADTEAHLQRVAAQLAAQRAAAQHRAEADKREEDNQLKKVRRSRRRVDGSDCVFTTPLKPTRVLTRDPWPRRQLHDALVAAVASDAAAVAEAAAVRPAPETVAQRLHEVKQMARPAKCVICLDDELTVLDGIFCRAVPTGRDDEHFMCDPCFAHHVAAECDKPEFDGDVHCPHRSNALGCTSAPYHDALLAQHVTPAVFQQLQGQRLKLRENATNSRMQVRAEKGGPWVPKARDDILSLGPLTPLWLLGHQLYPLAINSVQPQSCSRETGLRTPGWI